MTRTVISKKDVELIDTKDATARRMFPEPSPAGPPPPQPDDYKTRLLKYIPAEVVVLYVTLDALFRSFAEAPPVVYWAIFVFCLMATPLHLWRLAKVKKRTQLAIATVAFAVWVFALGGPFATLAWYAPVYGAALLPMYTFLIPIVEA